MSTAHIIAQLCMLATLILMITGKTPIYMTAIVGAAISALIAGFPMAGGTGMTVTKMIVSGLNPVIADMTGILLFIGIMQATGFLDVIIRDIVRLGNKWGGGVGVACAGGVAAGVIGALTGFTQPVITAVICGPAAVRLGVRPNQSAGMIAHAGHIGNLAGFTHPTQVAILATAGIGYGLFNVLGFIAAGSIFVLSAIRATADMRRRGIKIDAAEKARIIQEIENREYSTTSWKAFFPFLVLVIGFICGLPIGMVQTVSDFVSPVLSVQPVLILFAVAFLTGFMTQSYAASVAVLVPFLQVTLQTGADPFASAFAAASGCSLIQYFLTGGPVAALSTVIPVIPGSDLKGANAFQRPSILFGCLVAFIITACLAFL